MNSITNVFDLVHFWAKLQIKNTDGSGFTMISTSTPPYNGVFEFEYDFVGQNQTTTSDITVHNLTPQHAKLIRVGSQCDIWAGWQNNDRSQNNICHILSEQVAAVQPMTNQSGDYQLQFTISDFQKIQNEKAIETKISKKSRQGATLLGGITGKFQKKRKALTKWHQNQTKAIQNWAKSHRHHGKGTRSTNDQVTRQAQAKRKQLMSEFQKRRRQLQTAEAKSKKQAKSKKSKTKSKASKRGYAYKTFKKGTYASTIIRDLAKLSEIKIKRMHLVYNKKYLKGYTASQGEPQTIESIAQDCKSQVFYVHGGMVIDSPVNGQHLNFTLNYDTGLLQDPSEDQEDDDLTNGTKLKAEAKINSYEIQAIFIPFLTMRSVFRIQSPVINGLVQVTGGSLSYTAGSTPSTDVTVQLLSDIKRSQSAKAKLAALAKKNKEKISKTKIKSKSKKDSKRKSNYTARRAKRTSQRLNKAAKRAKKK